MSKCKNWKKSLAKIGKKILNVETLVRFVKALFRKLIKISNKFKNTVRRNFKSKQKIQQFFQCNNPKMTKIS